MSAGDLAANADAVATPLPPINLRRPANRLALLTRFPAVSLLLTLAVAGAWWDSYRAAGVLLQGLADGRAQLLASDRGTVWLVASNLSLGPERRWTWDLIRGQNEEFEAMRGPVLDSAEYHKEGAGFQVGGDGRNVGGVPGGWYRFVAVPHWSLVTLLGLFALARLRRWARYQRRAWKGLCLNCGYDLRASAGRCPECGAAIPAGAADASVVLVEPATVVAPR